MMNKLRKWLLATRLNFLVFNFIFGVLICYILSFTPLTLKGSYLTVFLADIVSFNLLYDYLIKRNKKKADTYESSQNI